MTHFHPISSLFYIYEYDPFLEILNPTLIGSRCILHIVTIPNITHPPIPVPPHNTEETYGGKELHGTYGERHNQRPQLAHKTLVHFPIFLADA